MLILSIAIPLLIFAALYYFISYMPAAQKDWEAIPDKAAYQAKHADLSCHHCGGHSQLNIGLTRITDYRRKTICTKCKTVLWREQD